MNRGKQIGLLAVVALSLGGCSLAGTVAVSAISALASGDGGAPRTVSPGKQLQEAISGIDDKVSASCSERLRRADRGSDRSTLAKASGSGGRPAPSTPTAGVPGERPAGAAPHSPQAPAGPLCAVRATCLPGTEQPVMMMVCEHPSRSAEPAVTRQTERPLRSPGLSG